MAIDADEISQKVWTDAIEYRPPVSWKAVGGAMVGLLPELRGRLAFVRLADRFFMVSGTHDLTPSASVRKVKSKFAL
jgi:hypothetical protein